MFQLRLQLLYLLTLWSLAIFVKHHCITEKFRSCFKRTREFLSVLFIIRHQSSAKPKIFCISSGEKLVLVLRSILNKSNTFSSPKFHINISTIHPKLNRIWVSAVYKYFDPAVFTWWEWKSKFFVTQLSSLLRFPFKYPRVPIF